MKTYCHRENARRCASQLSVRRTAAAAVWCSAASVHSCYNATFIVTMHGIHYMHATTIYWYIAPPPWAPAGMGKRGICPPWKM